jgi:hypothetical protein
LNRVGVLVRAVIRDWTKSSQAAEDVDEEEKDEAEAMRM